MRNTVIYKGREMDVKEALALIEREPSIILDSTHITTLSGLYEVEDKALRAVIDVESAGRGFDRDTGLIMIQFEPYHFRKYTGLRVPNGVEHQSAEWKAYRYAVSLGHEDEAMLSTSWGMMQVMGFNHEASGYDSVRLMVDDFKASEVNQLLGALNFIQSNKKMYRALQEKDWPTFAYYYNGAGYKKFNYDIRLENSYNKYV